MEEIEIDLELQEDVLELEIELAEEVTVNPETIPDMTYGGPNLIT